MGLGDRISWPASGSQCFGESEREGGKSAVLKMQKGSYRIINSEMKNQKKSQGRAMCSALSPCFIGTKTKTIPGMVFLLSLLLFT